MSVATLHGDPARFEGGLHELAAGVHAWLQPNGGLGESNAGVVVGEREALLVDTLWDLPLTRRMLAAVRGRVAEPLTTLVNTHADGDHIWGNQLFRGGRIVATELTAEVFDEERPQMLRAVRAGGLLVGRARGLPVLGSLLGERPSFGERAFAPYDFSGIRLTPPTETFSGELALDVGGREVRLIQVGPAHSPGDLIVFVPDAATVFAADIMMRGGLWPVMWAGPISNWIGGLDEVLELEPEVVVPGHGPVCSTADVEEMRALMVWIRDNATAMLDSGRDVRETTLGLLELASESDGPWSGLEVVDALHITVATIDRHRRGASGLSRLERIRVLGAAGATARAAEAR